MKPRTFKTLLMRSAQQPQYSQYYALLEEALVHYSDYQLALEKEYIINFHKRFEETVKLKEGEIAHLEAVATAKDEEIAKLIAVVRRIEASHEAGQIEIKAGIAEVKGQNTALKADIAEVKDLNIELKSTLYDVGSQVADIGSSVQSVATLLESAALVAAPLARDRLVSENLMIVRLNHVDEYNYRVVRRQRATVSSWTARTRKKYPQMQVLLDVPSVPNARSLWHRIKERLNTQIAIRPGFPSSFRLANHFDEAAFVACARAVYEEPQHTYAGTAVAAKARVQSIVENVTQQVLSVLTPEDFESLGF